MLQDHQGYLWLRSGGRLCRYDGAEFTSYTTSDGLVHENRSAICEDHQKRLWFAIGGTGAMRGVSCFDGQNFITYTTDNGLVENSVEAICEDDERRLWFGTSMGASCFDGQSFITYTTDNGLVHNYVAAICKDHQGRLWFGTSGGVSCFDGQDFINYTTEDGLAGSHVRAIFEDHQGHLWSGTSGGASCFDGQNFITYTTDNGLASNSIRAICGGRQGNLWFAFGFDNGVSRFDGHSFTTYTTEDGLLDDRVTGIIRDREGHLWFAHLHSGLTRLDPETLILLTTEPVSTFLIQTRQGGLWFNHGNVLCCLKDQQLRRTSFDGNVYGFLVDSRGRLWAGTWGDGLYCYDSIDAAWDKTGRHFSQEDGVNSDQVFALLEARDGTIWAGVGGDPGWLCRFDGEAFEAIPTPHPWFWQLFEDSQGRIWMSGLYGKQGGLSCYDGERLTTYTVEDGLPSDNVKSIVEDDAGNLWFGTWEGLCCFDGTQFITYAEEEGLFSLFHQCSAKDATGQLWFGTTGGGVYRYDGEHFQWLTEADGFPSNSISGFAPQPDGSMIIGTLRGIVHYRPTAVTPPRIEIREVVADQVYRSPAELELTTTGTDLLTISYHGLDLATNHMRYSYVLEGHDEEWQDTWDSQVSYENLPVGEYTFKVIAINRDLVPSKTPAILRLTVIPDPRDVQIDALQTEVHHLRREVGSRYHFQDIIGSSTKIRNVRALMERAIDSGLTVLITGETGTGKELVAKAIHYNSPRKDGPMLNRNCGAIPGELVASELFGHHKGAFTGADEDRIGLFEAASGGAVFLDEIGEMPQDAQVHLLRVLDDHKVRRIGGNASRDVDVRVIAATNRDLRAEVEAGRFREDLYYRLSVLSISIPPLRERREDIPVLAEHFLQEYSAKQKKKLYGFAPDVLDMLQSHTWSGNVRELQNAINVAVAFAEEGQRIQLHHFPRITQGESLIQDATQAIGRGPLRYRELVNQFERRCIEHALRECNGNRSQAAKMLGIERKYLYEKIKRFHIDIPANISPQPTDE
jgi:DNA-binding NtrC family response regulator/ligand-binding sensor domain-containing protein